MQKSPLKRSFKFLRYRLDRRFTWKWGIIAFGLLLASKLRTSNMPQPFILSLWIKPQNKQFLERRHEEKLVKLKKKIGWKFVVVSQYQSSSNKLLAFLLLLISSVFFSQIELLLWGFIDLFSPEDFNGTMIVPKDKFRFYGIKIKATTKWAETISAH